MRKNGPYLTARVPAITLKCPVTMIFVDQVYAVICSKNACDTIEYTLKKGYIEFKY